jgi:hypothetical protein
MTPSRTLFLCFVLLFVYGGNAADTAQPKAKPPDISVDFQRFITEHNYQCAEFMVSNCTAHTLWFTGYSLESPVYDVQYLTDGQWEDSQVGWCGVGMDRRPLAAHETIKFKVLVEHDAQKPRVMRVGLSCSPKQDYKKEVEKTYWSEKVEPKQ